MNSKQNSLMRPFLLACAAFVIVGGHHALEAVFLNYLLRPDLSYPHGIAALVSSAIVQLAVGAFWASFACLFLRVGGSMMALGICLWTALATVLLRVLAEFAGGFIENYPVLLITGAITVMASLLGGSQSRRVRMVKRVVKRAAETEIEPGPVRTGGIVGLSPSAELNGEPVRADEATAQSLESV